MPTESNKVQRDQAVAWLRHHPGFSTESGRLALRSVAFAAVPGAEPLLDLDLSGDRDQAAERLVERLRAFGCLDGRHALGLLLEQIAEGLGDDRRPAIQGLIQDLDLHCTQPAGAEDCPYLGLNAFCEPDARWFFGREPFVETLVAAVDKSPMVAVIGPSGSGKSSLVQAGLFPVLRECGDWTLAVLRPGHDPWSSLAGCLCDLLGVNFSNDLERAREIKRLGAELAAATRARGADGALPGPADLIDRIRPGRLLLLVDQWEELYTHGSDRRVYGPGEPQPEADHGSGAEPLAEHFANALIAANAAAPVTLVLTLRADFYHRLLEHRWLADAVRGPGHVDLSPMNQGELRRAIVEPARKEGLVFESGLPERILEDLGNEPGLLPLLELCLTLLWERRRAATLSAAAPTSRRSTWPGSRPWPSANGSPDDCPCRAGSWCDCPPSGSGSRQPAAPTRSGHIPGGPKWTDGCANTLENGLGRMVAVGLYPAGRSEHRVMDLAGNAWDWCLNEHARPERTDPGGSESRVVRGGSWNNNHGNACAPFRNDNHPVDRNDNLGFRVLLSSHIHHSHPGYRQVRSITVDRMRWGTGGWRGPVPPARPHPEGCGVGRISKRGAAQAPPDAGPAAPHPRSPAA